MGVSHRALFDSLSILDRTSERIGEQFPNKDGAERHGVDKTNQLEEDWHQCSDCSSSRRGSNSLPQ